MDEEAPGGGVVSELVTKVYDEHGNYVFTASNLTVQEWRERLAANPGTFLPDEVRRISSPVPQKAKE